MSSPRKNIDQEKQTTMFGQLTRIEKQASATTKQMNEEIELIKRLQQDFSNIEVEAKLGTEDSRIKLNDEIKGFEEKIKGYLITQKAEYTRFANQINSMIQNSREINAQLTLLGNKFEDFEKNVGI